MTQTVVQTVEYFPALSALLSNEDLSMSEIMPEIAAIIQMLNAPMQQALTGQETLRNQVDELRRDLALEQERGKAMGEDVKSLKEELDEMKQAIIKNQERTARQIIAFQSAVLLLIIAGAVTYYFAFLPH